MKRTRVVEIAAAVAVVLSCSNALQSRADDLPARPAGPQPYLAPPSVVNGAWSLLLAGPDPPPPPPPPTHPSGRVLHTAIYDAAGDRTIVFGGVDGQQTYNDTWSLSSSGVWTQLDALGTLPTQRRDQTAIYDPSRTRMVVFGGCNFDASTRLNDVHALSLSGTPTWTAVATAGTPPSGRFSHAAIYDPVRDRMLVFGGYNGSFLNEVWQLTFSGTPTWSRVFPTGTPPNGRDALFAVYDPVRDRMLFFGGWDGTNFRNDVWALSLSGTPAWSLIGTVGTVPSGRRHYSAVYDAPRDRIVLFGGEDWGGPHDDLYALSLSGTPTWTTIAAGGTAPSQRSGHRAVFDAPHGRMILFGGYLNGYLSDSFALSLASPQAWSPFPSLVPPPPPPPTAPTSRRDHVAVYDALRDRMIIFGGWDGHFLNDTWALSLSGTIEWNEIVASGTPPSPRFAHTAIYDDVNDRLVVFGGYDGSFIGDVWALTLSGTPTWTQLLPSGAGPAGRNAMTALLDPTRRRMEIFGGWDGADYRGDLWTLNLDGPAAWTQQVYAPGPAPSARRHYAAIHDPGRDEMVISGGLDGSLENDTWILDLSRNDWQKLGGASQQAPAERDGHRAIFDTERDRMIVFGGYGVGYMQDSWALSLSPPRRWTGLAPTGSPPQSRLLYTAIYDPVRDRAILFGGEGQDNVRFGDVWALDFAPSSASQRKAQRQVSAALAVEEGAPVLAMRGVHPNPWSGLDPLTVSFSLPGNEPARLELFSISGQRLWVREVGGMGSGIHEARFDPGSRVPPGLYMVRLSSRGTSFVNKVAKLR